MEEQKNDNNIEKGIYSPRRRKNSKNNAKMMAILDGLGRRHESDKNALKFIDFELNRKKTLTKYTDTETIFNSNYYLISQLCITIFILIEDEIKNLFTKKTADLPFSIIIIIFLVFYIIELIMYSLFIKDYFLNFYFWLDIVSIITTLLDIHWFYNSIIESVGGGKINNLEDLMRRNESKVMLAIKVFKIIRIIRIVRITKLYITIEKIILKIKRNNEEKERRKRKYHECKYNKY